MTLNIKRNKTMLIEFEASPMTQGSICTWVTTVDVCRNV